MAVSTNHLYLYFIKDIKTWISHKDNSTQKEYPYFKLSYGPLHRCANIFVHPSIQTETYLLETPNNHFIKAHGNAESKNNQFHAPAAVTLNISPNIKHKPFLCAKSPHPNFSQMMQEQE